MTSPRTGLHIALAAVLVQAPRLVLALLAADRQSVDPAWERVLVIVAGIGTALVLTGGNLYLAHTVALVTRWRSGLLAIWLCVLFASGALAVPLIAAGLTGRTLPQVLASPAPAWAWSILAALAHELTAASCILASVAAAAPRPGTPIAEPHGSTLELHEPSDTGDRSHRLSVLSFRSPAVSAPASAPAGLIACRHGCGRAFRSVQAEIAHLRHCPLRPAKGSS